ncbi:uncharacterized protein LOC141912812 [Tubulanus polymorphus]|uniref:uncharacterized protein LOC141912812 n=1 Tax=Tubulanus polymorphus TaxID=672921 RepID=UPI003DA42C4B
MSEASSNGADKTRGAKLNVDLQTLELVLPDFLVQTIQLIESESRVRFTSKSVSGLNVEICKTSTGGVRFVINKARFQVIDAGLRCVLTDEYSLENEKRMATTRDRDNRVVPMRSESIKQTSSSAKDESTGTLKRITRKFIDRGSAGDDTPRFSEIGIESSVVDVYQKSAKERSACVERGRVPEFSEIRTEKSVDITRKSATDSSASAGGCMPECSDIGAESCAKDSVAGASVPMPKVVPNVGEKRLSLVLDKSTVVTETQNDRSDKRPASKNAENDVEGFRCKICTKAFEREKFLKAHVKRVHPERRVRCDRCSAAFKTTFYLKEHKETVHEKKYDHTCDTCGKRFASKRVLRRHLKFHDATKKVFACADCGKSFHLRYNLDRHVKLVHGCKRAAAASVCDACGKKFSSESNLRQHVRRIHLKELPFVCATCGKGFIRRKDIETHTRIHERYRSAPGPATTKTAAGNSEKNTVAKKSAFFACVACRCEFPNRDDLDAHIRSRVCRDEFRTTDDARIAASSLIDLKTAVQPPVEDSATNKLVDEALGHAILTSVDLEIAGCCALCGEDTGDATLMQHMLNKHNDLIMTVEHLLGSS